MAAATFPSTQVTTWPLLSFERFAISRVRASAVLLVAVTILAFGVRAVALSTYGLSEDEINKVRAIEQYRQGHFGANAEHPMLMKLAMWGSVELADVWNRVAPTGQTIAIESAIRLPNVLAGTLTTLALFGLAELLFGTSVAANVAVLSPDTWRYCVEYVQGTHLVHHGYLYAGQLYVTNIPISPLGVPATFYFRLLATKVPLVVLGATVAGLIEVVRRRRER